MSKVPISKLQKGDRVSFINGQLDPPDPSLPFFCPLEAEVLEVDRRWWSVEEGFRYRFRTSANHGAWTGWKMATHLFEVTKSIKADTGMYATWAPPAEVYKGVSIE